MGRRKSNGNATASVASPGPQKSRAHAHLTSAARFGTKLYSSIFVQTWALLSKVVQIMAELLPGLPNRRRDLRLRARRGAVPQQTKLIFSLADSFAISIVKIG